MNVISAVIIISRGALEVGAVILVYHWFYNTVVQKMSNRNSDFEQSQHRVLKKNILYDFRGWFFTR
jgi:hypothetical protein